MAKQERQPIHWPTAVAKGTPMIVATVRPIITIETAWARLLTGTSDAATRAATPK